MTRRTRRTFFYVLVAVFIVLGGGVVFYAQGWRLDIMTWHFEKIGGIYVRSYPVDAKIYLDGKPINNDSGFLSPGTLISELLPRTYDLELKEAGYDTWQENAAVLPSLATQFKYAVLVPADPTPASNTPPIAASTPLKIVVEPTKVSLTDADAMPTAPSAISSASAPASPSTSVSTLTSSSASALTPSVLDRATPETSFGAASAVSPSLLAWTRFRVASDTSAIVIYDNAAQAIVAASSSVPGKNVQLGWISSGELGVLQNDGSLYLYDANARTLRKLADDVTYFASSPDGSMVAALEQRSIEVFSLSDATIYYRFNLPNIATAQRVIWYKDDNHLFVIYPDYVSFLDLADSGLTNFTTVAQGTSPEYVAQTNSLYVTTPTGVERFDFPS